MILLSRFHLPKLYALAELNVHKNGWFMAASLKFNPQDQDSKSVMN